MAIIPSSQGFGEVIAQPGPAVLTTPAAQGAGLAQGLFRLGGTLQSVAAQEAREAAAVRDAADRATAIDALTYTKDDLAAMRDELAEGVRIGTVDKREAEAEWQRLATERIQGALDGVPQAHRGSVQRGLDHQSSLLLRDVGKAVRKRDQADVGAGIDSTMERAQRLYRTDPIGAEELVAGSLIALGPAAGLSLEQIGQRRQAWREGAQFALGYEAVSMGRDSPEALDEAEKTVQRLDALPPKQRAELLDRVAMLRISQENRIEAARRRAEDETRARLVAAEKSTSALQQLADKGTILAPDEIDAAQRMAAGTPYEPVVRQIVEQSRETGGLGRRSPAELDGILSFLDTKIATEGRSQALDKRREQVATVRAAMVKDFADDPFRAGLERGWIAGIPQIDMSSPDAMLQSLGERVSLAGAMSTKLGRPVSPLRDDEAGNFVEMLKIGEPRTQAEALAALSTPLTPDTIGAVADQVGKKREEFGLALKMGAGKTTADRLVSELILRGAQAIRDKTVKKDDAAIDGWRSQIAALVRGTVGSEEDEAEIIKAASYVMAAQQIDGIAAPGFSKGIGSTAEDAVAMVAGRPAARGGLPFLLPRGMKDDAFDDALSGAAKAQVPQLAPSGKVYLGGQQLDFQTQVLPWLSDYGIQRDGRGRFIPINRGRMLTSDPGGTLPLAIRVQ